MATLILCDHDGAHLGDSTRRALSAALSLGAPVDLLVAGADCAAVAEEAAMLSSVRAVLLADDPALKHQSAVPLGRVIVALAPSYSALVASTSSVGKDVMPRVAAMIDVTQVSEVTRIVEARTFEHPVYASNAIETVRVMSAHVVLTIRCSAFAPADNAAEAAPIRRVQIEVGKSATVVLAETLSPTDRPTLGGARVIIAGGRALGSKEQFDALLVPLADRLGAAIGASRAAVDAGYASNDRQVGQTGKIVAPQIYVAVGISGAIQHLAGIKDAKTIVAINKDAQAPIFEVADYGLVGDLFELVPELTRQLEHAHA